MSDNLIPGRVQAENQSMSNSGDDNSQNGNGESRHLIKLRGLPWNVSVKDILEFLKDVQVLDGERGIHLLTSNRDGRPNGEAFVDCATEADLNKAFEYNKNVMGHRYIEVFHAKPDEFTYVMRKHNYVRSDTFVKLRGLPYTCTKTDIETFFEGLELKDGLDGIHILLDNRLRATGEAFVEFDSPEDTEKALKKSRDKIGHRYIEIFRSTAAEVRRTESRRNSPYDKPMKSFGRDRRGSGGFRGDNPPGRGYGRDLPSSVWGGDGRNSRDNDFGNNYNRGGGGGGRGSDHGGSGYGGNNNDVNNIDLLRLLSEQLNRNNNDNFGNNNRNNFGNGGGGGDNSVHSKDFQSLLDLDRSFRNGNFGNGGGGGGSGGGSNFGNFGGGGNNFNDDFNDRFDRNNGGGNGGGGGNGFCVHLRGMPFDCDEQDIYDFFLPLMPVNCTVQFNSRGRHTGEGDAFFETFEEANKAMNKHKEKMGTRYIELFLNNPRNDSGPNDRFNDDRKRDFLGKKFATFY